MSRSQRKTPIFPTTNADSEKLDKVLAHRKERTHVRSALIQPDQDREIEPYVEHPRSGRWTFGKDGKTYDPKATHKKRSK